MKWVHVFVISQIVFSFLTINPLGDSKTKSILSDSHLKSSSSKSKSSKSDSSKTSAQSSSSASSKSSSKSSTKSSSPSKSSTSSKISLLGRSSKSSKSGKDVDCEMGEVVLVANQAGTGSRAVGLLLEKSGVFQMAGLFGKCDEHQQKTGLACVRTGSEKDTGCSSKQVNYGGAPVSVPSDLSSSISSNKNNICPSAVPESAKQYVQSALKEIQERVHSCVAHFGSKCPKFIGWKDSMLMQLIPEFAELHKAKRIQAKLLHVVRDGRDVAMGKASPATAQMASALLPPVDKPADPLRASMNVWSRLNVQVNTCAKSLHLPTMTVRMEDLMTSNTKLREKTIQFILDFIGIKSKSSLKFLSAIFTKELASIKGGGNEYGKRWKSLSAQVQLDLNSVGWEANALFGYGTPVNFSVPVNTALVLDASSTVKTNSSGISVLTETTNTAAAIPQMVSEASNTEEPVNIPNINVLAKDYFGNVEDDHVADAVAEESQDETHNNVDADKGDIDDLKTQTFVDALEGSFFCVFYRTNCDNLLTSWVSYFNFGGHHNEEYNFSEHGDSDLHETKIFVDASASSVFCGLFRTNCENVVTGWFSYLNFGNRWFA